MGGGHIGRMMPRDCCNLPLVSACAHLGPVVGLQILAEGACLTLGGAQGILSSGQANTRM